MQLTLLPHTFLFLCPRCWTYETSVLLDTDIKDDLPFHDYFEYYGPDYKLHLPVSNMENQNRPDYLETIKIQLFEILRYTASQCVQRAGVLLEGWQVLLVFTMGRLMKFRSLLLIACVGT